jgi:hypothetical protein
MRRLLILLVLTVVAASSASAANIVFISQAGGGAGTSCASPQSAAYFNNATNWSATPTGVQIGPDTVVHLCGTFTGAGGGSMLIFQASGTSGHPITLLAESGVNMTATFWGALSGAINTNGKSWIVLDGGATGAAANSVISTAMGVFTPKGTIQNTANGEGLANRQITTQIYAANCNNCVIKNWVLANAFINVRNTQTPIGGAVTQMSAITYTGQNGLITNNYIHDCGWCILDNYGNGDTGLEFSLNKIFNYNHGLMLAASSAVAATNPALRFHDNQLLDNLIWETIVNPATATSCTYHLDGIHMFGVAGSSIDGVYVYNNYFGGLVSACFTSFVFAEGGGSSSHVVNSAFWNNIFDATLSNQITLGGAGCSNCGVSDGWVGLFSSSSSIKFLQNTFLFANRNDGTQGWNIGSVTNLLFQGNVSNGAVAGNNIGNLTSTPVSQVNRNHYGSACILSNNCFIFNGSFMGSFATWKANSGFDPNSLTSTFTGILLNTDGSPQANSPVLGLAPNNTALCSGLLVTLCSSTTKGGAVTNPVARPAIGNWDAGAYQSGSVVPPNAPTGLSASVSVSTITLNWTASTGSPVPTAYTLYRGTVHGGPYAVIKSGITALTTTDTPANGTYFYTVTGYVGGVVSSVSGNGSTATVTCTATCSSFPSGTTFTIGGNTAFNGTFTSTGQPTGTTFTFTSAISGTGTGGGAWPTAQESAKSNEVTVVTPASKTATLTPASRTFGSFTVGTTSPSQSFTFTNTSAPGTTVTISAVGFTLGNTGDFGESTPCGPTPIAILAGSSCIFNVTFTPTAGGARSSNLSVVSDSAGSPNLVAVSGTGVAAAPLVSLNPTSLNFGDQTLSTTSTVRSIILTNTGSGTLNITSVVASGDFAVVTVPVTNCGGTLAPLATCSLNVTFTPTATGGRSGNLTITDNAAGSPQVAPLQGNGITTKCQFTNSVTLSGTASVCQ